MNREYEKLLKCYVSFRQKIKFEPKIAIVLGSGLGELANEIDIVETIPYSELQDFPVSTVAGHAGRFVFGNIGKAPVVIMQGRVHYYEGYSIYDTVLPIRLMRMMGAEYLILTNAAGGINKDYHAGDFMMIKDHIASFVPNPLIGPNIEEFGVRFPDMSEVYSYELQELALKSAGELGIRLQRGTYVQLTGPSYETPSEVRMCGMLGGDAVGMSTAVEAVAGKHAGFKICGISCISNLACGISKTPLSHDEVKETAERVSPQFKQLIRLLTEKIYKAV